MMDYNEAETLLGSETVKEIHNLLNESSNNLDDLLIMCDNISFSKINASINWKSLNRIWIYIIQNI